MKITLKIGKYTYNDLKIGNR